MLVVRALDVGDVDGFAQLFLEAPGDAPHLAHHPSRRAQRFGQVLGAEDEQSHHEDHEHLGYPDVEHRGLFGADRPADWILPFARAETSARVLAGDTRRSGDGRPRDPHRQVGPVDRRARLGAQPLASRHPAARHLPAGRRGGHGDTRRLRPPVHPDSTADDIRTVDLDVVHPLTGPVAVEGAQPGDLLVVAVDLKISEMVDVPNFIVSAFLPLDILT
jgi:hypothetical protein